MSDGTSFKPEVIYGFLNKPDKKFKNIVGNIVAGTVGNPLFPKSQLKALVVETRYKAYAPTVVERTKQNSITAAARVAARTPLEEALRQLLPEVQAESNSELPALLSTNIPLAHRPVTSLMPGMPTNIRFFLFGNPVLLFVQCDFQFNVLFFARISRDETNWEWTNYDKRCAIGFADLPTGETLFVQMMAKNTVGTSGWSSSKPFMIPPSGISIPQWKRPKGMR